MRSVTSSAEKWFWIREMGRLEAGKGDGEVCKVSSDKRRIE